MKRMMLQFCNTFLLLFCIVLVGDAVHVTTARPYICGLKIYYAHQHHCNNGILVPVHHTSATTTPITSTSLTTVLSRTPNELNTILSRTPTIQPHYKTKRKTRNGRNCIRKESINICPKGDKPICGKLKCCGVNIVYNPREETCCSVLHKTRFYNHPESKFVCYGLDGYERGKYPYLHASQNDRLWEKHPVLAKTYLDSFCLYDYVFVVKSVKRRRFLSTDRQIVLQQLKPTRQIYKLDLATDNYTPRKSLRKSPLLILSNFDRLEKGDFYVYTTDELFSRGKMRLRAINRKLRKCRKPYKHDRFS